MNPIVAVWRFTVRDTDGLQATLTLGPVNRQGPTLTLDLGLQMTLPLPDQDEHLPDQIEAFVHQAGLEVQRRLFRALIEKADQELVLQRRHGKRGHGSQRPGPPPSSLKSPPPGGAPPPRPTPHNRPRPLAGPTAARH